MSLQILCKGYLVANHEKPVLVKLIVKFMKKTLKTKSKRFMDKTEAQAWLMKEQEKIEMAYADGGTKGLLDFMGLK